MEEYIKQSHILREAAVLQSGGSADTSVPFAWWQQGEQAVVLQYPLGSAQAAHLPDITDTW